MRNAPLISLAEVSTLVQYGYTASASDTEIGPKFLRITDIVPPQIDWNTVPYCEIDENNLTKFSLAQGDIVIARTGATVGYAKLIRNHEPSVFASYLVRIRVDPEKADPGYVGRIVESDVYKRFILSRVGGAAQPNANAKVLSSFRLPIPERHVQTRIASILSAYDDLIENNRRRIQLLEQAARLLYKEWFIHLRFPGHKHVKIKDGVPEGWERKTFGKVVKNFDKFRVPLSVLERENRLGPYPYHGAAGIIDYIDNFLFDGRYLLIGEDGTVVTKSGSAMLQFVEGKFWVSNHAHVVQGSLVTTEFLYCFMSHYSIQPHITGVAQPKLSQQNLNRIEMLVPSAQLRSPFQDMVNPLIQQAFTLKSQIAALIQARDLLLPRLMNGQVAI